MAAVDVVDPIVPRQTLVQERVVGVQQLLDRAILTDLTLKEQLRFADHRVTQRRIKTSEDAPIRFMRVEVAHLQPLFDEVLYEPRRARGPSTFAELAARARRA